MRSETELAEIYDRQCKTVWNICYPFFMNPSDTEDAVQETFLRLLRSSKKFRDEAQEKAWLIVTARNICRDELRRARRKDIPLDTIQEQSAAAPEISETMQAIAALPERYRTVIYLYYYEGYPTTAIAQMLHRPDASIRGDLRRARNRLKEQLGGDIR